jgi:hypothetical protein
MSPDLIDFLLDALPWLALAVTLGYLVGHFAYPPRGVRRPEEDDNDGNLLSRPSQDPDGHDRPRRGGQGAPLQRSTLEALTSRPQPACTAEAEAYARQGQRLSASCATPPRVPSRRGPRSLH